MTLPEQIISALAQSPLLFGHLPEGRAFNRQGLALPLEPSVLTMEQKLGHLYEDGLALLLENSPRYRLLEKGLQLQKDPTQTVGELDFLIRDLSAGHLIHLELAVKFYLALDTPEGLLLPGPNSNDNYYNKLKHLRNHQLSLTKNFAYTLPEAYQKESIETSQLVIGCIFEHIGSKVHILPPFLHPQARKGRWMRQCEFSSYFSLKTLPLVIPKPLWPVDVNLISDNQCTPLNLTDTMTRCTLVKIKGVSYPIFLTPNDYPHQS